MKKILIGLIILSLILLSGCLSESNPKREQMCIDACTQLGGEVLTYSDYEAYVCYWEIECKCNIDGKVETIWEKDIPFKQECL